MQAKMCHACQLNIIPLAQQIHELSLITFTIRQKSSIVLMQAVHASVALATVLFAIAAFHPSTACFANLHSGNLTEPLLFITSYVLSLLLSYKSVVNNSHVTSDEAPLTSTGLFHCSSCDRDVPIRAGHCRKCGTCILRRDHHCPWLGVCIGVDNHLYYFLLLITLFAFGVLLVRSASSGVVDRPGLLDWLLLSVPCTSVYYCSIVLLLQPIVLIPFHFYLAFSNRTTWEVLRGGSITYMRTWTQSMSPFSRGLFYNFWEFLTMHIHHPSYSVPTTENEIQVWRHDNRFWSNDYYECC